MGLKLGTVGSGPVQEPSPEMASGDVPVAQVGKQTPVVQAPLTASHAERPEKFDGENFKRWQQKMLFYLTTLGLARFLTEDAPPSSEESDRETLMVVDVWKNSNYLCRNYVLNGLSDSIYGVYCSAKSAKELWKTLDRKYKIENARSGKFVVGKFLDYMMVDTKPLMSQVHELQVLIQELLAEGMIINEAFQVACMIEKLPLSWSDFRNYLKHKRKEIDMETLVSKLHIEDDNRRFDRRSIKATVKANVVEHRSSSKSQKKKPGMSSKLGPK
ncbi:uncharacterized protein LOC107429192 [Ziziphus jujuba]|uniref:Uncharacterized protein LOC107429192 n=1 Tax=Ziziphus jujuba TaxID=326968 RepID=A0A6P4AHW3_ZIZJJ|nr:uncharacterized protein LOC107429192 [Ziziphus jujuba]